MKALALLLLLLLAACQPQIIYMTAPTPEAAPAVVVALPPEELPPVWAPEIGHVYALDSAGAIMEDHDCATWGGTYAALYRAVSLDVEMHEAAYPADPWHVVGGGAP